MPDFSNRITEDQLNAQNAQAADHQAQEEYIYNSALLAHAQFAQAQQNQADLVARRKRKRKKEGTVIGSLAKWFGASGGLMFGIASAGGSTANAAILINHLT